MEAKLVVVRGRPLGKELHLSEGEFLIGRGKDCKLRPNSELVSRHHCCVTLDERKVFVREMGSTNGTFVNGKRIEDEVEARNGDMVTVGPLTFAVCVTGAVVEREPEPEPAESPSIGAEDIASDEELADWLMREGEPAPAQDMPESGRTMVIDTSEVPEEEDLTMAQNGEDDESTAKERAKQKTKILPKHDDSPRSTADAAGDLMRKYFQRQR